MALIRWITPEGNLGIVPALEYYEFALDAYDATGNPIEYSRISGILPPGIQVVSTGKLQGIPVSTAGADQNQTYFFTIRAKNTVTNAVVDRTFNLTITNVAPPVIVPKDVDLGSFFDGTVINIQLEVVEFILGDTNTWNLKSGELPPGLTLTTDGLLTGYLESTPTVGPESDPDWDDSAWDNIPWDATIGTIAKNFTFTVEVSDGVNTDVSTYNMFVYPKGAFRADSTLITVDTTIVEGSGLSTDTGARHNPVILTQQSALVPQRAGGYFQFQFTARDQDNDVLFWSVPAVTTGAFDEQELTAESIPYISTEPIDGMIYDGVFPKASISESGSTLTLYTGNVITANVGDFITQTISGANATVAANVTNSDTITLVSRGANFTTSKGNISLNGTELVQASFTSGNVWSNVGVVPFSVSTDDPIVEIDNSAPNLESGDVVQVLYESPISLIDVWYQATVTSNTTVRLTGTGKVTGSPGDFITQAISNANATILDVSDTTGTLRITGNVVTANIGDFVTQTATGANATITANTANNTELRISCNSGTFSIGSGNISINGSVIDAYPTEVTVTTDVKADYNTAEVFILNSLTATSWAQINGANTQSRPTAITSVGISLGSVTTQGEIGFDEGRFDQGGLELPEGLTINSESGWLTGFLPDQAINQTDYQFNVVVSKEEYPEYTDEKLFTLTVLGDLNNTINWLTPSNLGTIQNGKISDLEVVAISSYGKPLYYRLASDSALQLPQGLKLTSEGYIAGRVSFQSFSLDSGATTVDANKASVISFDSTYTFSVTASDLDRSISATKTFTIRVIPANRLPYENLYLKALLSREQRLDFRDIITDRNVFPSDIIYKETDPNFGLQQTIKTLFLAGLDPSSLAEYTLAADRNHFTKKVNFGEIKTAVAVDGSFDVEEISTGNIIGTFEDNIGFVPKDFNQGYQVSATIPSGTRLVGEHTKYEVVYVEISDDNTNSDNKGPANTIDLSGRITNPYYDRAGNSYTTAYPNAFSNMSDRMATQLGYANKGALPDWMTSRQPDGRVLGFTRAVVLAYVTPGNGATVAYRLKESQVNFNDFDFTVDRYQLDNNYSTYFNTTTNSFVTSSRTTFDRYDKLPTVFNNVSTVDYAVSISYESINNRAVSLVREFGGLDGITAFNDGDLIVFAKQEYQDSGAISDTYNIGWSDVNYVWDGVTQGWDYDSDTTDAIPGSGWDEAEYVPGYNENLLYSVDNQRIGIWRVNIDSNNFVTLTFVQTLNYNDSVYVRNGFTYGGTNIYYDPVVKPGNLLPNYSIIQQQIVTESTKFDGGGTRFYDNRDQYSLPEQGDKYIKFTKSGVFT